MSLTESEKQSLLDVLSSLQESINPTSLNLFNGQIGVEGMKILTPILSNVTSLTYLDISYNRLGVDGMKMLAPALYRLTSLKSLNISSNDLGDEGITRLAPALSNLTSLTQLKIYGNEIRIDGLKILHDIFYYHPSICYYPFSFQTALLMNRNINNVIQRKVTLFELIWNDQKLEPDYSYQSGSTGVNEFQ